MDNYQSVIFSHNLNTIANRRYTVRCQTKIIQFTSQRYANKLSLNLLTRRFGRTRYSTPTNRQCRVASCILHTYSQYTSRMCTVLWFTTLLPLSQTDKVTDIQRCKAQHVISMYSEVELSGHYVIRYYSMLRCTQRCFKLHVLLAQCNDYGNGLRYTTQGIRYEYLSIRYLR